MQNIVLSYVSLLPSTTFVSFLTSVCCQPPIPQLDWSQASLLTQARWMSSSCTGVFTAEVSACLIEKCVNSSGCGLYASLRSERCHESLDLLYVNGFQNWSTSSVGICIGKGLQKDTRFVCFHCCIHASSFYGIVSCLVSSFCLVCVLPLFVF